MKSLLFICLLLASTLSAQAATGLQAEAEKFVAQMNSRFNLNIGIKVIEECGFSVDGEVGKIVINFCQNDIAYFEKLPASERPLESLLTIIGHEYSHILIDTAVLQRISHFQQSFKDEAERIYNQLKNDEKSLSSIAQFVKEREPSEGETHEEEIQRGIEYILNLGTHENVDTLGSKLVFIYGMKPVADVLKHLPDLSNDHSELTLKMVKARTQVLQQSVAEGLSGWNSFTCVGNGLESPELTKFLILNKLDGLKQAYEKKCTAEEIDKSFQRIFRSY